jgi:hypothetical protein
MEDPVTTQMKEKTLGAIDVGAIREPLGVVGEVAE